MTTATEIKIPLEHPAFAGHFPGTPIVPGVVLLDEALYAIAAHGGVSLADCTLVSVKFRSVVRPGQPIELRFDVTGPGGIRFDIRSADQSVASGIISLAPTGRSVDAV